MVELQRIYKRENVLDAVAARMDFIFKNFRNVVVSVSGGKDSTALFDIAHREAIRRKREITLFFLDQEAEYQSTIDLMRKLTYNREYLRPMWFQVPIHMTNATSYQDSMLYAWGPGQEWMREKEAVAIKENPGKANRFYKFLEWFEGQWGSDTCFLVGLRSEESLHRYGAVTRNPAIEGIGWSSKGKGAVKLYPIYDFTFEDVWTYIGKFGVKYNRIYDYLYMKGENIPGTRVSNLIHEKSFHCLTTLHEFEPETYNKLIKRLKGVHVAAQYAKEKTIFSTKRRPKNYKTWKAYRDFLLDTIPDGNKAVFLKRFGGQAETERVYRQQAKQLLLNDWENNIPVVNKEEEDPLKKWREIL